MSLIRLHIAYDGTNYHGWQIQPVAPTLEGILSRAVTKILGANEPVKVQGASRTDAGVHAWGQVAHIRHDTTRTVWDFVRGLNALTPKDITINYGEEVEDGFHARHSARGKIYRYQIWNHRFYHPFLMHMTWQVGPTALDLDAMHEASRALLGEHDFAAFRAADCESETTVRTIHRIDFHADGPLISIEVEGTAFLKYMVRIIVGTLVDVGMGRLPVEQVATALASGNRVDAGHTAPPGGLALMHVIYPEYAWEPGIGLGGPVGG